ncbi:MAG: FISUMP domain-containing protein, partial [Ignavibacteria bacterium]|nr:FISUMP domain-containing protein [Ignavibacteria bacterium]
SVELLYVVSKINYEFKILMNLLFKANLNASIIVFSFIFLIMACGKDDNENGSGSNDNKKYGTFTDPRDQHVYKTIKIGNQTWMAENLAYLPKVVPANKVSPTIGYNYVYGYSGTNVSAATTLGNYATYGVLYNWVAALYACPAGWHLPSDKEWTTMVDYLIANNYNYDRTTVHNKIAKAISATSWWEVSNVEGSIGNRLDANNSSGFSALPGGKVDDIGFCIFYGCYGYWWSSTESSTYGASYRFMYSNSIGIGQDYERKESGFSVRCIKN